jgi:hypothetical protein
MNPPVRSKTNDSQIDMPRYRTCFSMSAYTFLKKFHFPWMKKQKNTKELKIVAKVMLAQ